MVSEEWEMVDEESLLRAQDVLTTPPDAPALENLGPDTQRVVDAARSWSTGPNVVGNGVAPRKTNGKKTTEHALKIYVQRKLPLRNLPPDQRIPSEVEIPGFDEPVPMDVEEIGLLTLESSTSRIRPLQPGSSIGVLGAERAGTLGCLVAKTGAADTPLMLSNNHVIAQSGRSAIGTGILQPGILDGGQVDDQVGELTEIVAFDFNPGYNNVCDAALAAISPGIAFVPALGDLDQPGEPTGNAPTVGQQVQKWGRTTGHTLGEIQDVHYRTYMSYQKPGGGYGSAGFRDQVLCSRYTDKGDSGALVCDMGGNAIGLHWAGSTAMSVFSPIEFVFAALGVSLFHRA
jgi:hypothetical protein